MALIPFQRLNPKVVISRARFDALTEVTAYYLWQSNDGRRRRRNWLEALRELGFWDNVSGRDPRYLAVEQHARRVVYPRHKDADALADWLQAEQEVRERYEASG